MKNAVRLSMFLVMLWSAIAAEPQAQVTPATDVAGVSVLSEPAIRHLQLNRGGEEYGRIEMVGVEGQPFDTAIRATTVKQPARAFAIQMTCPNSQLVRTGDVLYATFWMRMLASEDETGEGKSLFLFEQNGPPWNRSIQLPLSAGKDWRQFAVAFQSNANYGPGGVQAIFRLGYRPQVIEIADFRLVNYRDTKNVAELPGTRLSYHGRETDAAWRIEAARRIDTHRKADVVVTVTDKQGKPIGGIPVHVNMTRLGFDLGTAVKAKFLAETNTRSQAMQSQIKSLFNCVVFENDLKWTAYKPQYKPMIDRALDWCDRNGIRVRGHTMIWPSWRANPPELKSRANTALALEQAITGRIQEIGSAFAGRLYEWDVVNEPINHHDFLDLLGDSAMTQWFHLAHEVDPHARLYLNETGVPVSSPDAKVYDRLYAHVARLLKEGAPIHGIGMQGHFGWDMNAPEVLWRIFDRFADLGLPIKITEFDIAVTDEALAADYYRDFYTACFAHPAVNGILIWNIWEADKSWKPEAAIYRMDGTPKPAALALERLVADWHSDATGVTNADGQFLFRGYLGDYLCRIGDEAGQQQSRTFVLPHSGYKLSVELQ